MASVLELTPTPINSLHGSSSTIRLFQLTLKNNNVTVELSSLGASITKVLLPNYSQTALTPAGQNLARDDVVLSYATPKDQYEHKNTPFFGAIVGRVANRIKDGQFQLLQRTHQSSNKLDSYQLDKNNSPNHLHGGFDGFITKIWSAKVVDDTVQFTLISPDGDEGYPGGVEVTATYSLVHIKGNGNDSNGAKLCLQMNAKLLPGETKATPIALAQHSYFNLASHSSQSRILDHTLHLPNCTKFTPLDNMSIPTKEIQRVNVAGARAMDFRTEKVLADAMIQYGEERAGLDHLDAMNNVHRILNDDATKSDDDTSAIIVARVPMNGGAPGANLDGNSPYGFDHNYVIDTVDGQSSAEQEDSLRLAAILSHPPTGRTLRVSTTAPGVQLYTSNHLDGRTPPSDLCKDGMSYCQWQGICLETQTYPDSIFPSEEDKDNEFSKGRCFILRPGGRDYSHAVEYEFASIP